MKGYLTYASGVARAPRKVAVIGAGVAGCEAALALAESGYSVDIYDKNTRILQGSSNANPACLNTGPHYPDIETVKKLMRDVEQFLAQYHELPDICVKNADGSIKTRLYVVPQDAQELPNGGSVEQHFEDMNDHWAKFKRFFPRLKEIGGLPEDVFVQQLTKTELDKLKIQQLLSTDIFLAYRTREPFLNLDVYKGNLYSRLSNSDKITLALATPVKSVSSSRQPFIASVELDSSEGHPSNSKAYSFAVNASWAHADSLGITCHAVTNRIKVMAVFKPKPDAKDLFEEARCYPSVAVYGAFASVSYRGEFIYVTYEPETNISSHLVSDSSQMSDFDVKLKHIENMSIEEKERLAWEIAKGAVEFYPHLTEKNIEYAGIRAGVVRNRGKLTNQQDSSHHRRTEQGIFVNNKGCIIRDEAIKLPNGLTNALKLKAALVAAVKAQEQERVSQEKLTKLLSMITFCLFRIIRKTPVVQESLHRKQRQAFFHALNQNLCHSAEFACH